MKKGLCFDDVLLEPQYSDIQTRNEIDLSSFLQEGDESLLFKLPIISSPMDTITETHMATALGTNGGLGIVHRYNTISEQSKIVREVSRHDGFTATNDYYERAKSLIDAGAKVLCLDVAHGHHVMVKKALIKLKS